MEENIWTIQIYRETDKPPNRPAVLFWDDRKEPRRLKGDYWTLSVPEQQSIPLFNVAELPTYQSFPVSKAQNAKTLAADMILKKSHITTIFNITYEFMMYLLIYIPLLIVLEKSAETKIPYYLINTG